MERNLRWGFEYLSYNEEVKKQVLNAYPKKILDVGCGDGCLLQYIAESYEISGKHKPYMTGIDISEDAIDLAQHLNKFREINYHVIDVADVTEKYDCITCVETLEHIPDGDVEKVISKCIDLLNPGGCMVISVPTLNRPRQKKHFRHYDKEILLQEIRDSGVNVSIDRIYYVWKTNALDTYLRFTNNTKVYLRIRALDSYLYRKAVRANDRSGAHMLAILRK